MNKNQILTWHSLPNIKTKFKNISLSASKLYLSIYTLILFFSSLLVTGYSVYRWNQAFQIPLIHLINNPLLYPNDPFAATLPYYASMLWRIVALVTRFIPLEPLLLTLFLLERLFVIYAAGRLAQTFVPKSQLAVVGAMALFALAINPILGAGTIVPDYLEQTGFSIPFFLLATACFYSEKTILCAIWLAIGYNLNSMYGTYAITYLGAVFILDSKYRSNWKKWIFSWGLFLLLASPAIWLTLSAFGRNTTDNYLWLAANRIFYPYHFYPDTWNREDIGKFFVLVILLVTFLYQSRGKLEKLFKHGAIWAGVSLLWLLYACIAAYIAKSPSMLVMHPARGTDLWYCFAGIALVSASAVQVEESRSRAKRMLSTAIFSAIILFWHPLAPYILIVGLIILTLRPVWYYIIGNGSSNRLALLLTLFVVLVGVRDFKSRIQETGSVKAALLAQPSSSIEQVANWARVNTSIDAQFLIDPIAEDVAHFRSLAKRSVFVTWRDGAAILWDRPYVKAWRERLSALGLDITQPGLNSNTAVEKISKLYEKLQDEDVKQLQSNFPLSYWIVPVNHPSKLKVNFQNQFYKVLNLS